MTTPTREPVTLEMILVSLRMVALNNTETFMIGEDVRTLMDYITHIEQSLESAGRELEAMIRRAVEITRLDGGVNFQGDMTFEMSVDEIVSAILGEGE